MASRAFKPRSFRCCAGLHPIGGTHTCSRPILVRKQMQAMGKLIPVPLTANYGNDLSTTTVNNWLYDIMRILPTSMSLCVIYKYVKSFYMSLHDHCVFMCWYMFHFIDGALILRVQTLTPHTIRHNATTRSVTSSAMESQISLCRPVCIPKISLATTTARPFPASFWLETIEAKPSIVGQ